MAVGQQNAFPELLAWWAPSLDPAPGGLVLSDLSGNGNDGALVQMDPNTDWGQDAGGGHLDFDGGNDYVSVSHNPSLGLVPGWSFSGHVNIRAATGNASFIDNRLSSIGWRLDVGQNRIRLLYVGVNGSKSLLSLALISDLLNQWVHLAITYDGFDLRLFVNGELNSSQSETSNAVNNQPISIGRTQRNFEANFLMDDFRIFGGALTDSQVLILSSNRGVQ